MKNEDITRNTSMMNIYQRINEVMKEVSYIQKDKSKKVNGQYSFISHDQVSAALHEPMTRHGIVMLPSVEEMTQDGNRTVAKIVVSFVNIDKPEDRFSVTYYGYGIDTQDKGPGKAMSYAVKYALLKTFCLETGDDDNIELSKVDHDEKALPGKKETQPVKRDKVEAMPEGALTDRIIAHKKELLRIVGGESKRDAMIDYLAKMATAYKRSADDIAFEYTLDNFKRDFMAWEAKARKQA